MRLVCPNCGAQYEVPEEVIPTSGRDVQCSDCGNTWFQHHPDHQPEPLEEDPAPADWQEEPEPDLAEDETPVSEPEEVTEPHAEPEPEDITAEVGPDITQEIDEDWAEDEEEEEEPAPESGTFSRQLDPSVAEVLREEAELETTARASEQHESLETQEDLGLDNQRTAEEQRSQESRNRMARLRGEEPVDELEEELEAELEDHASRRNLLPDIDEINSSLQPDQSADSVGPATDTPSTTAVPKSGFSTGFRLAVVLAVLALLLYVFAPKLTEAVPALAEPLAQYQSLIDGWRDALDRVVNDFASSLSDE